MTPRGPMIAAVILAAGSSSRLGTPKQLLPYGDISLLRHCATTALASSASKTYVVLGASADRCRDELRGLPLEVLFNAEWASGMSSSLRCALTSLPADCAAVLWLVCDQPRVTARLLNRLLQASVPPAAALSACTYGGTIGVPAVTGRRFFPEILALTGDVGAKTVLLRHRHDVATISFPEGTFDIDHAADLHGNSTTTTDTMMPPTVIISPIVVPAAGSVPKVIEEFIGRVTSHTAGVSIARMRSPAGWEEPGQTPAFDEYTLVLNGMLRVEHRSGAHEVRSGQAVIVPRGTWVKYSSPEPGGADYIAVCIPAFSPDTVHRDT